MRREGRESEEGGRDGRVRREGGTESEGGREGRTGQ